MYVWQASKAALHSLCDTLDMELKPFGIGVTEVWAGTMKTDINSKVADKLEWWDTVLHSRPCPLVTPVSIVSLQPGTPHDTLFYENIACCFCGKVVEYDLQLEQAKLSLQPNSSRDQTAGRAP